MIEMTEQEKPDEILHLGDHIRDAETLSFAYPDIPVTMVPGNCDDWWGKPSSLMLERDGVKILMGHGHQWRVKSGCALAVETGREAGADILLYGHTHEAVCMRDGAMWVVNPGTVGGRWARASYAVIETGEGEPCCCVFYCDGD